ncbi:MAG: hypothetical protein IT336_16350 [Thermomicrobiales bacterium]|nr:hypothetical protein [Thermomicrobiales bacterium]
MDDIRILTITRGRATTVSTRPFRAEAQLGRFVVRHARALLGLTVLATEYPIDRNGGGRIDALALDRNLTPVILEFKQAACGTALCQGLVYLDWLERHRDAFTALVARRLGNQVASRVNWGRPRLLCVAGEISSREEAVARQIGRVVEVIQVHRFPRGLVLMQHGTHHPAGKDGNHGGA